MERNTGMAQGRARPLLRAGVVGLGAGAEKRWRGGQSGRHLGELLGTGWGA